MGLSRNEIERNTMSKSATLTYRRRQTDWQNRLFTYVGLPSLAFDDLKEGAFVFSEIVKPRWSCICKSSFKGVLSLEEEAGIKIFRQTFEGKTGVDLENAAAELLLTSGSCGEPSDWQRFNEWAARRSQPLDPRLIDAFARFYVCRLNVALKRGKGERLRAEA